MVVLDDVENAKLNSRYFDLKAITLNKVAANINSFTVFLLKINVEIAIKFLFKKFSFLQMKVTCVICAGTVQEDQFVAAPCIHQSLSLWIKTTIS